MEVRATASYVAGWQRRRHFIIGLALLGAQIATSAATASGATLCHRNPGKPNTYETISVNLHAMTSHLAHGDFAGTCEFGCPAIFCDDNDACTDDSGTWTVDGNGQTGHCACTHTAVVCDAFDQCHDVGTCDSATGCSNPALPDGTNCDDDSLCTSGETCLAGVCDGGISVSCAASDQCHDAGTCNPASGMCSDPLKPDFAVCVYPTAPNSTGVCIEGECNPCGYTIAAYCCAGVACDPGLVCGTFGSDPSPRCAFCGGYIDGVGSNPGEPCCADGTCDPRSGFVCDPNVPNIHTSATCVEP